jgi:hypothetical protein
MNDDGKAVWMRVIAVSSQERRLNLAQPFQGLLRALPIDVPKSSAFPTGVKIISRGYAAADAV